jgi:RNA polymerase sigma-70 factor (ECF subfamily)
MDILRDGIDQFQRAVQPRADADLAAWEQQLRQTLLEAGLDVRDMIAAQTDETLALAIQHNFCFRESYDEFFSRFEPQMRSWLMHLGVDYHRALDLAQTLLLRCFLKRLHTYDPQQGSLKGYLRRATRNLWVEKEVRPACRQFSPLPREVPARTADAEEELAAREMGQRLAEAMAELPAELRAVLELCYLEGLSHAEIAQRLGITTPAVGGRLFKARRALEERLGLSLPPTNRGRPRHHPPSPFA